ncbi:MAG: restriction endonuclease [Ignisphaera sp.]|uniref:Restriction endonuclease type IV Mrr domain-containing protein n=1 Tax=Ignisphaera aggregans TaxID=334771 RepID=A0A832CC71_9CREN
MNYIDIYDFIEQLFKYRSINKYAISSVNVKDRNRLKSLIEWCIDNGVIEEDDDNIRLLKSVEFLTSLPHFDISPNRFNIYIEWHEFEQYVSQIFAELGWDVYMNYTHTKADRFQIDVIAMNDSLKLSLFVECKHWKRTSRLRANIDNVVGEHIKRIEKYLRNCEWVCTKVTKLRNIKYILPIVIVLLDLPIKVFKGIPIIPIYKLVDFVTNIDSYTDALDLVLYKNRCYSGS